MKLIRANIPYHQDSGLEIGNGFNSHKMLRLTLSLFVMKFGLIATRETIDSCI